MTLLRSSESSIHAVLLSLLLLGAGACAAEPDEGAHRAARLPDGSERGSQPAEVTQRMGSTELRVVYNRPAARGRILFGDLVPYDSIWNPGADEATRIHLTDDVLVEGEPLPAGSYSIWAVPRPDLWTLIFSRAWDVFHVPYPEGDDQARIDIAPRPGDHVESMSFTFPMATADSARLELRWGDVLIPMRILPAGS